MHKYELLRLRAETFKRALEEYAKTDSDVEWLLEKFLPWYEQIQGRKIRLPCHEYKLGVYFSNSDLSPLAERYGIGCPDHPLGEASALLGEAMSDWLSSPIYIDMLKKRGQKPSATIDAPPPPEEEAYIPESKKSAEPRGIGTLLHRLLHK